MSERNTEVGQKLYSTGDTETRQWFEHQWRIWPMRADERLTTNISFHFGGVLAFRVEHGREPDMSPDFRSHVTWHDQHSPYLAPRP